MGEPAKRLWFFWRSTGPDITTPCEGVSTRLLSRLTCWQPLATPPAEPVAELSDRAAVSAHRLSGERAAALGTEPQVPAAREPGGAEGTRTRKGSSRWDGK